MRSSQALRTLELEGAPRERGRRHGQTLGAEIRQLRRALLAYLARVSLYAGALPLFGGLLLLARSFLPQTPSRLKQEMAALAAGAQVSPGSVLLINVLDDLANSTPRCSALAVGEGHTRDGCYLMGRNLDYPLFVDILARLQMLFLLEPDEGQALASLAWPGYVGVCTGINKAGVALAQLSVPSRDRSLTGMPAALRFRLALEGGASA
ncbi:MAG: C45 family autoproteolytic acyltransferase/hydrolase, partial [Desulfobaccales bacterium]